MSPVARFVGPAIVVLAVAWAVAGGRVMDRIDAALTRDTAGCARSGDRPPGDLAAAERATLCLLDHEREAHGLPAFTRDERLDRASRRHSRAMARTHFFAHRGADGTDPIARMRAAGWPRDRGGAENIAWGARGGSTPAEIVDGWMHSPGHRRNILDPRLRLIGVGIAAGSPEPDEPADAAVYTTDFGL
jgi:uncharacterized protein YkwD